MSGDHKRFWNRLGRCSAGVKEEKHFLAAVISENLWEYRNAKRMLEIMKISGNNKEIPVFFIWRHRHRKKEQI